jgi:tRNA(fMet)-specific endonuclease VapC
VICLDTNAVIAIMNQDMIVQRRLISAQTAGETIAISVIVLFELRYGAEHSRRPDDNHVRIDAFLEAVEVHDVDSDDAFEAAKVREALGRVGKPIGPLDLIIATQARRRGAAMVTANTKEFSRVPGLRCLNWLQQ